MEMAEVKSDELEYVGKSTACKLDVGSEIAFRLDGFIADLA